MKGKLILVLCALCVKHALSIPSLQTERFLPKPFVSENISVQRIQTTEDLSQRRLEKKRRKSCLMVSLVTLTGITEGICYRRFGFFPNMMTGNTVRCMDALADMRFGDMALLGSMILSYISGGALFQLIPKPAEKGTSYSHLAWVAGIALFVLGLSDFVGVTFDRWRMPLLAIGFGLINAAANDSVGSVTNAVTGHWTKIGLGTAERLMFPDQESKGWTKSIKVVGTFMISMFTTTITYKWLETQPSILSRLPPLGTSLGFAYAMLFCWYSQAQNSS